MKSPKQTSSDPKRPGIQRAADTCEQIRARAYELYEQRGREDGHDIDDWLQAEEEITQEPKAVAA